MQTDDITLGKHGVQIYRSRSICLYALCRHERIICQDLHSECFAANCYFAADRTVSCDTELLSIELESDAVVVIRMCSVQRSPDYVLDVGYIVDIIHRLTQMFSHSQSGCCSSQLSGLCHHQRDAEFRNCDSVSSRSVGEVQSCCLDCVKVYGDRCSLSDSDEFHSGVCPCLDGVSTCDFIAEDDHLASHALFFCLLFGNVSFSVLQFTTDDNFALFLETFYHIARKRGTNCDFLHSVIFLSIITFQSA